MTFRVGGYSGEDSWVTLQGCSNVRVNESEVIQQQ